MTLIETLIYIALLGMLMTTLVISAFTFLGQNQSLERKAFQAENDLLIHFNDFKE